MTIENTKKLTGKILLSFIAGLLSPLAIADEEPGLLDWVKNFSIEATLTQRTHELEFLDSSLENSIILMPNIAFVLQAKLFYKEHKLTLATDRVTDYGIDEKKGKSTYTDIHYSGFFDKDEYSVYYGRYQGFMSMNSRILRETILYSTM